ncbi:hypothetical protein [Metaclostridioides mangenotii]|uniref:hypothetical protein n=1 Tax=Metaclostridioides mangenotii TaxID=1540 RepID=UPI00046434C8|nr:hypothetical protein [Clostridioides mangenotii]
MTIILGIILIFGVAYFQSILSSKSNKYLGLIFPLITFIGSIVLAFMTISIINFSFIDIFSLSLTFIMINIPSIVLLVIYYLGRKDIVRNKELDKMNLLDLN